ncbi:MAG: sulfide/dihydroorotate dehydrogenase-like FAD/NAD-binding protein [Methanosarcinales archaeon]|nr:sulfide/dihydroorotate dehydrogenase-like FAD/NAD-binding protein [Methanosarcinales archaeon]
MFKIIKRQEMAGGTIILNEIAAPRIARKARPGQFVILKANETGERIPLTMADFNPRQGTITVIYAVVGRSTSLFSQLQEGDSYQDVVGPLGRPTRLERMGTVVCIGGGTGVAVLYPIARGLKLLGNRVISIIGAREKELLILEDEMRAISDDLLVCTDGGSYGQQGLVTDLLAQVLQEERPDLVVAIGPVPMMRAVSEMTRPCNIKTLVSLNPIMIDGTGMCGGCRVSVGGEIRFACVDGPEFDGHQVDFDELMQRLQAYRAEERQSLECESQSLEIHRCKMEPQIVSAAR